MAPNILFILADQFRADALACVGRYGRTDALDGLAREGVLFRGAKTNSPECMPARFALATGLYPHQTGVRRNGVRIMRADAPSWIRVLAAAGYRTSLFGKSHWHDPGPDHDLRDGLPLMHALGLHEVDETAGPRALLRTACRMTDVWEQAGRLEPFREDMLWRLAYEPLSARPSPLGAAHHYDVYVGERARDYLRTYDRPEPWFCWVSFPGPHEPWDAPEPYGWMHKGPPAAIPAYAAQAASGSLLEDLRNKLPPPHEDQIAAIRASYAGSVTLIDQQIAGLLDVLRTRGELESTLIVFTSDHGEMNGDHGLVYKSNFFSQAVDIPLIIRPPGATISGRVSDALTELMDVGATVLDYAGCAAVPASNGRSLRPIVENLAVTHRDHVLCEFRHHSMVADAGWKAEFNPDGEVVLLFDLTADAAEIHNLAVAPEFAPQAEKLAAARRALLAASAEQIRIV